MGLLNAQRLVVAKLYYVVLENGIFGSPKGHFSPRGPTMVGRGVLSAHTQVPPLQKQALFSDTGSKCYTFWDPDPDDRRNRRGLPRAVYASGRVGPVPATPLHAADR